MTAFCIYPNLHVLIVLCHSVGRSGVSWGPKKDQRYVGDNHEEDRHPIENEQQQRVPQTGGAKLRSPQVQLHIHDYSAAIIFSVTFLNSGVTCCLQVM